MKLSYLLASVFLLPLITALSAMQDWPQLPVKRFDDGILGTLRKQLTRSIKAMVKTPDESEGLAEYEPIRNSIGQSGMQYYSFSVNASTGLGEFYEYLVFVTGNICLGPADHTASRGHSLTVYYSFNSLILTSLENSQMAPFKNGYFQALAEVSVSSTSLMLYIAVQAPQSTNTSDSWAYEIGVSQNALVYQWDSRLFVDIVDTDHESALILTGNLTVLSQNANISEFNTSLSSYQLLIFADLQRNHFAGLNESWCAVRNGPALHLAGNYSSFYTIRGGFLRQQFYVAQLNASTQYVGYLISDLSELQEPNSLNHGGVLYAQFQFETMSNNACKLVYDLDFCDNVAYSVPALSLAQYSSGDALKLLYDDQAKNLYVNFSKAIQQIPCNTTKDAIFSPLGSCEKCATLYKNWLCSVTIPRCSTRDIAGYLHRDVNQSRTDFINLQVVPAKDYYEVLPCVNVCQVMTRDCPADFGFTCPKKNSTIRLSYYWDNNEEYATCNFVGAHLVVTSVASIITVAWRLVLAGIALLTMAS